MTHKSKFFLATSILCFLAYSSLFAAENPTAAQQREKFVAYGKTFIGTPYQYGGTSRQGMDCSGFVYTAAYDSLNIKLPRVTTELYATAIPVPEKEKEAGDLLFFRTVGSKISHVGIFIGRNQFIHAASDGPNTGVIISSLSEAYWKKTYVSAGRFLPPSGAKMDSASSTANTSKTPNQSQESEQNQTATVLAPPSAGNLFLQNLSAQASGFFTWNLYNSQKIIPQSLGGVFSAELVYDQWQVKPGLGFSVRILPSMDIVQIPLILSLTFPKNVSFYWGPVFTAGNPKLTGNNMFIKAPVFPGIFGCVWQSPSLDLAGAKISFAQEISYTHFTNPDSSDLSAKDSLVAGLAFSTGIRVTLPLRKFIR